MLRVQNKFLHQLIKRNDILLIVLSILFSGFIIFPSIKILSFYYDHNPFYYDPVTGISKGILFYERMLSESHLNPIISRLNFAFVHFQADPKTALFYIPTIILFPKLLSTPFALVPAIFIICTIFFIVLGKSLKYRNHSWNFILLVFIMVATPPIYWDCFRGLITGWYDLPTAFLLSSSIICLINWLEFNKKRSLYFAVIFVSLSCVARSIFAVYGIITFIPAFLFILIYKVKLKQIIFREFIIHIIACIALASILAGIYHLIHFENNFFYYTHMSITGKVQSSSQSFISFLNLSKIIGIPYLIFSILTFIVFLCYTGIKRVNLIVSFAIIGLLLIFWIGFYHMGPSAYHVMLSILPLSSILFLSIKKFDIKIPINKITFLIGLISFPTFAFISIYKNIETAKHPSSEFQNTKQLNSSIAKELIVTDLNKPWSAYFDEDYTRIINCELYFQYGKVQNAPYCLEQVLQEEYIEAEYPNKSIDYIISDKIKKLPLLKFIVIYSNHPEIDLHIEKRFRRARKITHALLKFIDNNENWVLEKKFFSKKFGKLSLYKNKDEMMK